VIDYLPVVTHLSHALSTIYWCADEHGFEALDKDTIKTLRRLLHEEGVRLYAKGVSVRELNDARVPACRELFIMNRKTLELIAYD